MKSFSKSRKIGESMLFENIEDAHKFCLAGKAFLTLNNKTNDVHFTYLIQDAKWVRALIGPDNTKHYVYIGLVDGNDFVCTKGSNLSRSHKKVRAFRLFWGLDFIPDWLGVWHSGKCGKCGRLLTVPESITRGIGPICAEEIRLTEMGRMSNAPS